MKDKVLFESWMKRGARVTTSHGEGKITYVRKNDEEVLNFNVKIEYGLQYEIILCSADEVKPI